MNQSGRYCLCMKNIFWPFLICKYHWVQEVLPILTATYYKKWTKKLLGNTALWSCAKKNEINKNIHFPISDYIMDIWIHECECYHEKIQLKKKKLQLKKKEKIKSTK